MKLKSLILAMFLALGVANGYANELANNLIVNESNSNVEKFEISNTSTTTEENHISIEETNGCRWTKYTYTDRKVYYFYGIIIGTETIIREYWKCT